MISALEIMREVRATKHIPKPPKPPKRIKVHSSLYCVRHPLRLKNPLSKSHCDDCLEMYRNRYTPKHKRCKLHVPRMLDSNGANRISNPYADQAQTRAVASACKESGSGGARLYLGLHGKGLGAS